MVKLHEAHSAIPCNELTEILEVSNSSLQIKFRFVSFRLVGIATRL